MQVATRRRARGRGRQQAAGRRRRRAARRRRRASVALTGMAASISYIARPWRKISRFRRDFAAYDAAAPAAGALFRADAGAR